jgi:hypothetical protein
MFSKLLLASVASIGLLVTGPQKASAQTISACVNSVTGLLYVVTANANCPPASGNVTWTKTTLSQTPGAIASRQYNCSSLPQTVPLGTNVSFVDSGIGFGTTLPTPVGPFTSFLLQPGFYQAHWTGIAISELPGQSLIFGGVLPSVIWSPNFGGDRLFSVTTANTNAVLELTGGTQGVSLYSPCLLILTQLH